SVRHDRGIRASALPHRNPLAQAVVSDLGETGESRPVREFLPLFHREPGKKGEDQDWNRGQQRSLQHSSACVAIQGCFWMRFQIEIFSQRRLRRDAFMPSPIANRHRHTPNRNREPVSPAGDCLNVVLPLWSFPKLPPQQEDVLREIPFFDVAVGPDCLNQYLLADNLSAVLNEGQECLEGLEGNRYDASIDRQN